MHIYSKYSPRLHLKCQVILKGSSVTVTVWDGAGQNFTSKFTLRVWIRSLSPTSDCQISSFYHTNPNGKYPLVVKSTLFSRSVSWNCKLLGVWLQPRSFPGDGLCPSWSFAQNSTASPYRESTVGTEVWIIWPTTTLKKVNLYWGNYCL